MSAWTVAIYMQTAHRAAIIEALAPFGSLHPHSWEKGCGVAADLPLSEKDAHSITSPRRTPLRKTRGCAGFWIGAGLGVSISAAALTQGYVWITAYIRESGVYPVNVALYADICGQFSPDLQPSREVCVSRAEAIMSPLPPFLRERE